MRWSTRSPCPHGRPRVIQHKVNWHEREDGMIEFRARLPKDEAALVIAAIRTAKDQFGRPPAKPDPCGDAQQEATSGVGVYSNVDGLLDVALGFLNTAPEDGSGEDAPWWWCRSRRRT